MERTRKPTSPGEIIRAHYLEPLNMTIGELAKNLEVPTGKLAGIVRGEDIVDVDMAMRLSLALATTPELWLNLQSALDLWQARQQIDRWQAIKPLQELANSLA